MGRCKRDAEEMTRWKFRQVRNSGSRWVQRALIAAAVLALLAAAAYVWGNRLNADTQQASTQRSADASASRYGSLRGLAAVRAVDVVAAPRASALQGVAAVRALETGAAANESGLRQQAAPSGSVERHVPGGGP